MADMPILRAKTRVLAAEVPGVQALLTLAVSVVVIAGLYLAREVLVPITLAVLLSFVLAPLVDLLRRLRLPRVPAALLAVVLGLAVVLTLAGVIGTQLADLASGIPRYAGTIERKADTLRAMTLGRVSDLAGRLGAQLERAGDSAARAGGAAAPPPAGREAPKPIPVEVHQPSPTPLQTAERVLAPVLGPLSTAAIVFVVAVFVLLQREDLRDRMIRLFGSRDLHRATAAMDDAARRLSRYFLTQLALNAAFGLVIGAGLLLIGVPNPALWGITAALLRFVPYVGSVLSGLLPTALAAAVDPGWSMAIETALLFVIAEPVMGQVVEPLVYGHSTGLSPVSVVIAAIFWTWLWGPVGLILSMPLTLCLVVLGRHVDRLEFIDVLLGDRPALTPVEGFYQRMLAGDADEALHQAEMLLRERALSSYYDEVAIKGLALAALDAGRGVLEADQLDRVRRALGEVVADLADHADVDPSPAEAEARNEADVAGATRDERALPKSPPPGSLDPAVDRLPDAWAAGAPVLCVAARGPLDEAAAAMLAQLLGKHGIGARVASEAEVSRERIGGLDVAGVRMVCVSFFGAAGGASGPGALRYLVRRLRARVPEATVLLGLWDAEEAVLRDDRTRSAIGADVYVPTLRDAVNACLETARVAGMGAARVDAA